MLSQIKIDRIKKLYFIHQNTGQDEFPFNDKGIKDGLNIYFGKEPTHMLFTLYDVIDKPIYVGVNEVSHNKIR